MIDYKQEAIKINSELIGALEGVLILNRLVREVCPPKAYMLAFDDVRSHINNVESQINLAKAREKTFKEDQDHGL
ncbi:MAG: hypothetical protein M0Q01_04545 [Syntrophales bacterium]|jgi:hypothetical protein|nr:hypothetical protein [Syntrophales bacterium]